MTRLLIFCCQESDLSRTLKKCFPLSTCQDYYKDVDLDLFDAYAFLGGTQEAPPSVLPIVRHALALQQAKGKPVFGEYTLGLGEACFSNPKPTGTSRPVSLKDGRILDEQSNTRLPVSFLPPQSEVLYQYTEHPAGYLRAAIPQKKDSDAAIFLENPVLMQCAFRMSDFMKARFTPAQDWQSLVRDIVAFLGGSWNEEAFCGMQVYGLSGKQTIVQTVDRAENWFVKSGMLLMCNELPRAVYEGISSIISPDGTQKKATQCRLDSMGETALMYELRYQAFRQEKDRAWANALFDSVRAMQVKEGTHAGMVRGSMGWWGNASYQDDASRGFILPLAMRAWLTGDLSDAPALCAAADYLLLTTGTDGLRVNQVNRQGINGENVLAARLVFNGTKWKNSGFYPTTVSQLHASPAQNPSAHYNAWYMAALLLLGKLMGIKRYMDAGEKGLASIMRVYPQTAREHSQTQELCRLILPLSILYMCTKSPEHLNWLHRVTDDLAQCEYKSGAYVERDEGYMASCSRAANGECSVFYSNNDPVCDLLYSMNWLPVSFVAAWYATGEERYRLLFRENVDFLASIQLTSSSPITDGAWARGFDAEKMEVNGVNNDREWSIWTIEAGWTVAEITNGMLLGLITNICDNKERL